MSIRLSIVEDDEPTRRILADVVRSAPDLELLSDYGETSQALELLPRDKPDVVLMDINLTGSTGVECVRHLKPLMPGTQFLMFTVYEDSDHIFAALAAGATGYLLKDASRADLLAAIQQIAAGGSPMSSSIARRVVSSFAEVPKSAPGVDELSPREQSVLLLLTKGYLYKEIAEQLGISGPTVNTYIRRIYEKLQVHSRSQAIAKFLKKSP
ncbi:MAG: response regulator transcription factor [Opitutaceae bacterium]|nr:response regulator transcription factor [Opitutaceae bacterium]